MRRRRVRGDGPARPLVTATARGASGGRARALAGVVVAADNFQFTSGEDKVSTYESEFAPRNFCSSCGSALYDDLGENYFVAAGLMRDLDLQPSFHLQVAYKAPWHTIGDDAPAVRREPAGVAARGGPLAAPSPPSPAWRRSAPRAPSRAAISIRPSSPPSSTSSRTASRSSRARSTRRRATASVTARSLLYRKKNGDKKKLGGDHTSNKGKPRHRARRRLATRRAAPTSRVVNQAKIGDNEGKKNTCLSRKSPKLKLTS